MNQVEKLPIIQEDPWLDPYVHDVHERFERYKRARKEIEECRRKFTQLCQRPLLLWH